jgi:regulator of sigma E protease
MNLVFPIFVYFAAFYFQTSDLSSRLGRVEPDRPAYSAGLRAGDRITSVDGTPVKYFTELQQLIGPKWDKPVAITFQRGSRTETVNVVPQKTEDRNILETETRGVIGVAPMASAPLVGIANPASPAARAGLATFDRIAKVDGKPIATYPDLELALAEHDGPVKVTVVRDVPEGGAAGSLTVYKTVELTLTPDVKDGKSDWGIEPTDLFVLVVRAGSPAAEAGLRRGDRLFAVNDKPLHGWSSFDAFRKEQLEQPFSLAWLHAGEKVERTVAQKKIVEHDEFDNEIPALLFGAVQDNRYSSYAEAERIPVTLSVVQAFSRSLRVVPDEIRKTGLVLARLVQGRLSFKSVGGPIMMYDIASRAAEAGFEYFLQIMALISINLGIMNLLPIPVLDGFHILSAGFESVRGRPMSIQARTIANYIGLAMLLTLMVFVFKNDIMRFIVNN